MSTAIDLTGMTFGRLTVLRRAPRDSAKASKATEWVCRCSCSAETETVVRGQALRESLTVSCGCYQLDVARCKIDSQEYGIVGLNPMKGAGNRMLTFEGKTQSVSAWAREKGLTVQTLFQRLDRSDWTIERALTTPQLNRKKPARIQDPAPR